MGLKNVLVLPITFTICIALVLIGMTLQSLYFPQEPGGRPKMRLISRQTDWNVHNVVNKSYLTFHHRENNSEKEDHMIASNFKISHSDPNKYRLNQDVTTVSFHWETLSTPLTYPFTTTKTPPPALMDKRIDMFKFKPSPLVQRKNRRVKNFNQRRGKFQDNATVDELTKFRISPFIYRHREAMKKLREPITENSVKLISYFMPWEEKEIKRLSFSNCRYNKCAFVYNMSQADLVAFPASDLRDHDVPAFDRPANQRWVMYTVDPAIRGFRLGESNLKNKFNATNTYNLDADIPQPFGRLARLASEPVIDYDQLFDRKTKLAAWFVSHCSTYSRRERFVSRMQALMKVDVYGDCGPLKCAEGSTNRGIDNNVCLPMLTTTYKFYFAFENSFCLDYVTEKFFKLFSQGIHVIPVVYGGFQYKKYLPAGIFINAEDFESPEELAKYLIDLGNDKQRYIDMLRRKNKWRLIPPEQRQCLLCEYLHSNPPPKVYEDLGEKFGSKSCWYPKGI